MGVGYSGQQESLMKLRWVWQGKVSSSFLFKNKIQLY